MRILTKQLKPLAITTGISVGIHASLIISAFTENIINIFGGLAMLALPLLLGGWAINKHIGVKNEANSKALREWIEDEKQQVIKDAQSALANPDEIKMKNWGSLIIRAEFLGSWPNKTNPAKFFSKYDQKTWNKKLDHLSGKVRKNVGVDRNPIERFQKAHDCLNPGYYASYRSWQGKLYRRLTSWFWGGNCQTQAELELSTMHSVFDWKTTDWKPAYAIYKDHIQLVLFDHASNYIYDPIVGEINQDHKTSVFRPEILLYGFLRKQGIQSPKSAEDLVLYKHKEYHIPAFSPISRGGSPFDLSDITPFLPYSGNWLERALLPIMGPLFGPLCALSIALFPSIDRIYKGSPSLARTIILLALLTIYTPPMLLIGIAATMLAKDIYQDAIAASNACAKKNREYAFFSRYSFTKCPPPFAENALTINENNLRISSFMGILAEKLRPGHKQVKSISGRFRALDPYAFLEYQRVMEKWRKTEKGFVREYDTQYIGYGGIPLPNKIEEALFDQKYDQSPQLRFQIILEAFHQEKFRGSSPYQVGDLDMTFFKEEHIYSKNTHKNVSDFLTRNGITENSSEEEIVAKFNELIEMPNFNDFIDKNTLILSNSTKAKPETILKNKKKLAEVYPLTLYNIQLRYGNIRPQGFTAFENASQPYIDLGKAYTQAIGNYFGTARGVSGLDNMPHSDIARVIASLEERDLILALINLEQFCSTNNFEYPDIPKGVKKSEKPPRKEKNESYETELVSVDKRAGSDQASHQKQMKGLPVFVWRFINSVEKAYPNKGKAMTWKLKSKLLSNPSIAANLGIDPNIIQREIEEGGFGIPTQAIPGVSQ